MVSVELTRQGEEMAKSGGRVMASPPWGMVWVVSMVMLRVEVALTSGLSGATAMMR